jgi:hypothetical protein
LPPYRRRVIIAIHEGSEDHSETGAASGVRARNYAGRKQIGGDGVWMLHRRQLVVPSDEKEMRPGFSRTDHLLSRFRDMQTPARHDPAQASKEIAGRALGVVSPGNV